ncbi:hypothetical protein KOR42_55590 [Thalassoglobus neptunius]|uniref:Ice-binding protein C-terminal domain-containing protein n=1 Tax=Thalassoglobus neptunius TaxID=1938619 RepID=A0A5C5URQ7_9PLAN|nr:PEP-CTERM sorting domain-containing protein [Thalassoglobus neptunius]TWT29151.1 hypothetical protein KOR42_55590 [Thalassoglobus neptunius]
MDRLLPLSLPLTVRMTLTICVLVLATCSNVWAGFQIELIAEDTYEYGRGGTKISLSRPIVVKFQFEDHNNNMVIDQASEIVNWDVRGPGIGLSSGMLHSFVAGFATTSSNRAELGSGISWSGAVFRVADYVDFWDYHFYVRPQPSTNQFTPVMDLWEGGGGTIKHADSYSVSVTRIVPDSSTVPEPSSIALVCMGIVGLFGVARRSQTA